MGDRVRGKLSVWTLKDEVVVVKEISVVCFHNNIHHIDGTKRIPG